MIQWTHCSLAMRTLQCLKKVMSQNGPDGYATHFPRHFQKRGLKAEQTEEAADLYQM